MKEEFVCFGLCNDLCMFISKLISCDHEGGGAGEWRPFPVGPLRFLSLAAFTQWLWAHKLGQRVNRSQPEADRKTLFDARVKNA